jgi:hypothetical protein
MVVLSRFAVRAPGRAFGLALAVRPAGSAEAPGSTARQRRVPLAGCEAPLRLEGPTRTMRGVPPPPPRLYWHRRGSHKAIGLILTDGRGTGPIWRDRMRPVTGAAGRGSSARLAGSRPEGVTKRCRPPTASRPALTRAAYGGPLWPLISPRLTAPASRAPRPGRQARRALARP